MEQSVDRLPSIHEVLADARSETARSAEQTATQTFRLSERVKELTDQICKANGTTSSEFLRKCCEQLVADYNPSK